MYYQNLKWSKIMYPDCSAIIFYATIYRIYKESTQQDPYIIIYSCYIRKCSSFISEHNQTLPSHIYITIQVICGITMNVTLQFLAILAIQTNPRILFMKPSIQRTTAQGNAMNLLNGWAYIRAKIMPAQPNEDGEQKFKEGIFNK